MLKMGYRHQRTLARPAVISGPGLVTGAPVQVKLHPAPENTGVVFVRSDRPGYPVIPARAEWARAKPAATPRGKTEPAAARGALIPEPAPPAQARSEDALRRTDPSVEKSRKGVRVIDPKI